MEKRLGEIELLGKKYPLNYSVRISQDVDGILAEDTPKDQTAIAKRDIRLISLMMEDAREYRRLILGEETETLTREQLEVLLSPADLIKLEAAISATIKLGGMRFIEAKPPKKEEADGEGK